MNKISVWTSVPALLGYTASTLTTADVTGPPIGTTFSGAYTNASGGAQTAASAKIIYYDGVNADVVYATYTITPAVVLANGDILNFAWTITYANKAGDEGTTATSATTLRTYFAAATTTDPAVHATVNAVVFSLGTPTVSNATGSATVSWPIVALNPSTATTITTVSIDTDGGTQPFLKTVSIAWGAAATVNFTFQWVFSES